MEPKELTIHDIRYMNIDALVALCEGKICETPGCFNECANGYRDCKQCLHGTSERADDFYVAAKKRLTKLTQKCSACGK